MSLLCCSHIKVTQLSHAFLSHCHHPGSRNSSSTRLLQQLPNHPCCLGFSSLLPSCPEFYQSLRDQLLSLVPTQRSLSPESKNQNLPHAGPNLPVHPAALSIFPPSKGTSEAFKRTSSPLAGYAPLSSMFTHTCHLPQHPFDSTPAFPISFQYQNQPYSPKPSSRMVFLLSLPPSPLAILPHTQPSLVLCMCNL